MPRLFGAGHNKMHVGSALVACVYESWPQVIEKEQWPSNNSQNLNAMDISCLWIDAQSYKTVSELTVARKKIWDNFRQVQLTVIY